MRKEKKTKVKEDINKIVTIDYYDKTKGSLIKVDVTKRVARFLNSSKQKMRRRQNQYNYFNVPFDLIFGENKFDNENLLVDKDFLEEFQDEAKIKDREKCKELKSIIRLLSPNQREVLRMSCHNLSFREIGQKLSISKQSAYERFKNAKKNILKQLKDKNL